VRAPLLNISKVFCDGSTACTVRQNNAFELTVNVTNIRNADHTGDVPDPLVRINDTGLGITEETALLRLQSGATQNVTFTINITS
ncbi:MAG: hypothetical protein SVU32_00515, partial [Candidatus Nanohaloarchaea archaeon]|nr:hypothetical protein [Candidatus Nanohaloarchaea archaeon]